MNALRKNGILGMQETEVNENMTLRLMCQLLVDQKYIIIRMLLIRAAVEKYYNSGYD